MDLIVKIPQKKRNHRPITGRDDPEGFERKGAVRRRSDEKQALDNNSFFDTQNVLSFIRTIS